MSRGQPSTDQFQSDASFSCCKKTGEQKNLQLDKTFLFPNFQYSALAKFLINAEFATLIKTTVHRIVKCY